ncbi:MAG TPA: T9SS type A sorting domain-containing protein [Flavobacteriales bacterium]|nr:T9SS type A sorting domain-containing protein [Flavobacteriales bacterium]HRQ85045.1 T9SS type A sorting domain-containing protein [Flavobacteriales bacterium]
MKAHTTWIIVISLSGAGAVSAQFPQFPDSNAFWLMDVTDGPQFLYSYGYQLPTEHPDTLIGGNRYSTVLGGMIGQSGAYYGGLREDTASRVFFYPAGADTEYLLYDFDPMVGDSILVWVGDPVWNGSPPLQMMYVETVEVQENNQGVAYNMIGIVSNGSIVGGQGADQYWIQGVGGTGGLFTTIGALSISLSVALTCMQASDTIWPGGGSGACWPTGVVEYNASDLLIFPNPSQGRFTLHLPDGTAAMASTILWNAQGKRFPIHPKGSGRTMSVTLDDDIPSGLYLMRVQLDDGTILHTKIIIQP